MRFLQTVCLCTLLLPAFVVSVATALPGDSYSSSRTEDGHWHIEASNSRTHSKVASDQLLIKWSPLQFDQLGNHLLISGQIQHRVDDGSASEPEGYLALTILVLKSPDQKSDWNGMHSDIDIAYDCIVAKDHGDFQTKIDLSETHWDRDNSRQIQIGVSVGQIVGSVQIWDASDPIFPESVILMDLPTVKILPAGLNAINSVRRWPESGTGTDFIRAINLLHKMPPMEARNMLRDYCRFVPEEGFGEDEIIYWIVDVLYKQKASDDPPAPTGLTSGIRNPRFMTSPIEIVDDIPFVAGHSVSLGGYLPPPVAAVRWSQQHGILRTDPLVPKSSPVLAAESLLGEVDFRQLEKSLRDLIVPSVRRQAVKMIEHLLGPDLKAAYIPDVHFTLLPDDDLWNEFLDDARLHPVAWNADLQQFELIGKK